MSSEYIERKIVIGLITSTELHIRLKGEWDTSLFESSMAKRIASWTSEYFEKYKKAPGKSIEPIFYLKVKKGLSKELAEEIEEDILPNLSKEFEDDPETNNIEYLVDEARLYFNERRLIKHGSDIIALVNSNKILEAEAKAASYSPVKKENHSWIDLSDPSIYDKIDKAFTTNTDILIKFPRALGEFWNDQFVKGGFVAFLAPEKRGKTFLLLELIMRARKQGKKVAFFQAGDMSENAQIRRIGIYLAKKSDKEKYCGVMLEPCGDCVLNQLNKCKKKERECNFGIFEGKTEEWLRKEVTKDDIIKEMDDNPEYIPCTNCKEYYSKRLGAVWMKEVDVGDPLTADETKVLFDKFFVKNKRSFKLSTHPTGI